MQEHLESPTPTVHILLAEDNLINQLAIKKWLSQRGWNVTSVQNGLEVLEAMERETFDLILMDIHMPKMDGITVTQKIREREQDIQKRIPVIALTAYTMEDDKQRFVKAGMDAYIAKPLDVRELYTTIEQYVYDHQQKYQSAEEFFSVSEEMILDFQNLLIAFENDIDFVKELIAIFFNQSLPVILALIQQAIKENNPMLLEKAAHRLKGASGTLEAKQVYQAASVLEQIANQQTLTGVHEALQVLEHRLDTLKKYLADNMERYLPSVS